MLVELNDKLISSEIFERKFICDISACKGACCVKGDAGAPIEPDEIIKIANDLDKIKPFMRPELASKISKNNFHYSIHEGEQMVSLNKGKECVFVTFDANGTSKCSIEMAFREGKTNFLKPLSCHLYPIRVKSFEEFEAINYEKWDICQKACELGESHNVPVFRFLKEPLIRAFGNDFYKELEVIADELEKNT